MSRREPTAWQNFWWDVGDWFHDHGLQIAIVLAVFLAFVISEAHADERNDLHIHFEVESLVPPEKVLPEHENHNLLIKVNWFDTIRELQEELGPEYDDTQAYSECEVHYEDGADIGFCEIWVVRPKSVDKEHTKSLGHEVLHGLLGDYHAP